MNIQYDAKILSIRQETDNISTFILERHPDFHFYPGQYIWISLEGYNRAPMAIASGQNDDHLMLTIRKWGELTTALFKLSPGDHIQVDGPYGTYFPMDELNNKSELYLIAGGTGITPIRSLLRSLTNGIKPHVFYGAQESKQLLYLDEFKDIDGQFQYAIDKPESGWNGKVGFVTDLLINVEFPVDATYFVCGPPPMLKSITNFFNNRKTDLSNVFVSIEKFDEKGQVIGPVLLISNPTIGL